MVSCCCRLRCVTMLLFVVSMVWVMEINAMHKEWVDDGFRLDVKPVAMSKKKVTFKPDLTRAEEQDRLNAELLYAQTARDVRNLVAQKANIDVYRAKDGMTALMLASFFCKDKAGFERVKALIECQSDVDKRDKAGNTALHWAAEAGWGYSEIIPLLIKYNVMIDACNSEGETALSKAQKVCPAMAEQLIAWGASRNVFFCKKSRVIDKVGAVDEKFKEIVDDLISVPEENEKDPVSAEV